MAEGHGKTTNKVMMGLYHAALSDLTVEQCILAFSRATEELRYWPAPAQLRELGGIAASGDPMEAAARASFRQVIATLRDFPMLHSKRGELLRTTGGDGRMLSEPEYAPPVLPPPVGQHAASCITYLGFGDLKAGLRLMSDHPSLQAPEDSPQWRQNALKASDELERRYLAAWRVTA